MSRLICITTVAIPVAVSLAMTSCIDQSDASDSIDESSTAQDLHVHSDGPLYPADARVWGLSQTTWSELLWAYIYAQPFDHNPFLDATGADCGIGQFGPVWFLPAVPGSSLGTNVTRTCTIPRGRSIVLQLASAMNDYPCPDPTFRPAPGQSLYDFLIAPIEPLFEGETGFEISVDGVAIPDPLENHRRTSKHVFLFKGDTSMRDNFDPCVTGHFQEAVSDGFYLTFKPFAPGVHTIVVNGHDMEGTPVTLTEQLTVR